MNNLVKTFNNLGELYQIVQIDERPYPWFCLLVRLKDYEKLSKHVSLRLAQFDVAEDLCAMYHFENEGLRTRHFFRVKKAAEEVKRAATEEGL